MNSDPRHSSAVTTARRPPEQQRPGPKPNARRERPTHKNHNLRVHKKEVRGSRCGAFTSAEVLVLKGLGWACVTSAREGHGEGSIGRMMKRCAQQAAAVFCSARNSIATPAIKTRANSEFTAPTPPPRHLLLASCGVRSRASMRHRELASACAPAAAPR